MKNSATSTRQGTKIVLKTTGAPLTSEEVKSRLRERYQLTLKEWASQAGYPYGTVSNVVRGINRATYGLGHRIAVDLGMKRG